MPPKRHAFALGRAAGGGLMPEPTRMQWDHLFELARAGRVEIIGCRVRWPGAGIVVQAIEPWLLSPALAFVRQAARAGWVHPARVPAISL